MERRFPHLATVRNILQALLSATEKFNVFASANYLKENGYVLLTDYERFSGRVNVNANPTKYLRLGINLSAAQSEMERSPVDSDALGYTNNPFSMTMNKAPIYPYYLHDEDGKVVIDKETQNRYGIKKGITAMAISYGTYVRTSATIA